MATGVYAKCRFVSCMWFMCNSLSGRCDQARPKVSGESTVNVDSDNLFKSIPDDFNEEIFTVLMESGCVKIERIVSTGQSSPPSGWYDQEENEWVVVLEGEAILAFPEIEDIHLKAGDYINIPAHQKHRVSWTKPDAKTVWLAVFYK